MPLGSIFVGVLNLILDPILGPVFGIVLGPLFGASLGSALAHTLPKGRPKEDQTSLGGPFLLLFAKVWACRSFFAFFKRLDTLLQPLGASSALFAPIWVPFWTPKWIPKWLPKRSLFEASRKSPPPTGNSQRNSRKRRFALVGSPECSWASLVTHWGLA